MRVRRLSDRVDKSLLFGRESHDIIRVTAHVTQSREVTSLKVKAPDPRLGCTCLFVGPSSSLDPRPRCSDCSGEYKFDRIVYRDGPVERVFIEQNERNCSCHAQCGNDQTVTDPRVLDSSTNINESDGKRYYANTPAKNRSNWTFVEIVCARSNRKIDAKSNHSP